jgi:hypothetical protein
MPQNFPRPAASLHDVEVWESLPEDVRASVLRLHQINYLSDRISASQIDNLVYDIYSLGYKHGQSNVSEYSVQQILSRYFFNRGSDAL